MRKNHFILMAALVVGAVATSSFVFAEGGEGQERGKHKGAKMFKKADLDGDGVISKSEFLKNAEERFKKMDLDGNGEITKEEAKQVRQKMKEKWKEKREKHKTEE